MVVWKAHLSIHLVAKSRLPLQVERTVAIFLPDPMSCLERKGGASFPSEGQAGKIRSPYLHSTHLEAFSDGIRFTANASYCVDPKTQTKTDIPTQYTLYRTSSLRHLNPIVIVAFDINIAWSCRRIWHPFWDDP
ncbi:uncharacterized protein CLUP02_08534 [Colletotrichum lupini]|uniref:Uncharacterized protein n=1 Tax=Colletotrichum lupini TaxID=145971 RepID=A0A9Q8ST28_9PEZI|nr:uncharacterized protein CLUP02_08534 [Colletotrichum lupini]UQC83044.1 hypothetical protein CLUP02_08534 [Colletotrichum lupini]